MRMSRGASNRAAASPAALGMMGGYGYGYATGTATAKGTGTVAGRGLDATLLTGHEKIGGLRLLCPGTAQ